MLSDEDRIFKNLYNDLGSDLNSAKKRGEWSNTKELSISHPKSLYKFLNILSLSLSIFF